MSVYANVESPLTNLKLLYIVLFPVGFSLRPTLKRPLVATGTNITPHNFVALGSHHGHNLMCGFLVHARGCDTQLPPPSALQLMQSAALCFSSNQSQKCLKSLPTFQQLAT